MEELLAKWQTKANELESQMDEAKTDDEIKAGEALLEYITAFIIDLRSLI
jgi:hypothetical protein